VILIWLLAIYADIIKTHKIAGLERSLVYKTAFEHLPDAQPKFRLHFQYKSLASKIIVWKPTSGLRNTGCATLICFYKTFQTSTSRGHLPESKHQAKA
jgi:hypothetical protein